MATYKMTAADFISMAKKCATLDTVYAYGGLGYHGTPDQIKRMVNAYPKENSKPSIVNADEDTWFFDCIGFVKSILNGFTSTKVNPQTGRDYNYGGASFPSTGYLSAKSGASDFFNNYCTNKSDDFSNIKIGEAVWLKGSVESGGDSHIGIYIGDGLVAECTPKWDDGVQITAISNIGAKSGYNARKWDYHGIIPCVDYSKVNADNSTYTVQKGDSMWRVAKKLGISLATLKKLNPQVKAPFFKILPGQVLKIK